MEQLRSAVIGIGATGTVLAAALLSTNPETALVGHRPELKDKVLQDGITVSGSLNYQVPVTNFFNHIADLKTYKPEVIFIASKTFHLPAIIRDLQEIFIPGMKIVSTHNGLGTEDVLAEVFGPQAVFRMSLNYGASVQGPGEVSMAFFNPPNPIGGLASENHEIGSRIAATLTAGGLDTAYVDDIKLHVWKKMIMKCTMASICAVTDKTIKEALDFAPTREIADGCFQEALSIAKAKGYDLGQEYLQTALAYLEKVGTHKDSMCVDVANKTRTEIDFLGGKVVEYGKELGIPTPYYTTMTNLVKALESNFFDQNSEW
jgi:2-dehydropantoate 2-reductase